MKNMPKHSQRRPSRHQLASISIRRRLGCLILVGCLPLLLGATCGLETCDILNCDTLPFIKALLAPDEHTEDAQDDEDGQMDMDMEDGEEHVGDDTQDDGEDQPMADDEVMHDDDDGLDEGTDGDDPDADAEDHDEGEEG